MEGNMSAEDVAKKAIKVAADICVFTNENVKIEKI
jgi:ATP-dependent HslUV protease subunit HslV